MYRGARLCGGRSFLPRGRAGVLLCCAIAGLMILPWSPSAGGPDAGSTDVQTREGTTDTSTATTADGSGPPESGTVAFGDIGVPTSPGPGEVVTIDAPRNLVIVRSAPNLVLDWDDVPGAIEYRVYTSADRFAPWPWALLAACTASQYVVAAHLSDGLTHYYLVRAWDGTQESGNSTIAVKYAPSFAYTASNSNVAWFSLPYVSPYTRASDIANELTSARIDVVGRWDPAKQWATVYYYADGRWRGTDFTIPSGSGLYISYRSTFNWVIVGTDKTVALPFTYYPPPNANGNWISVPPTSKYQAAHDIVLEIEGSLGPSANTRIVEVATWNPSAQAPARYMWTPVGWSGPDFPIAAGASIYLKVVSTFAWTPGLLTPEVI